MHKRAHSVRFGIRQFDMICASMQERKRMKLTLYHLVEIYSVKGGLPLMPLQLPKSASFIVFPFFSTRMFSGYWDARWPKFMPLCSLRLFIPFVNENVQLTLMSRWKTPLPCIWSRDENIWRMKDLIVDSLNCWCRSIDKYEKVTSCDDQDNRKFN